MDERGELRKGHDRSGRTVRAAGCHEVAGGRRAVAQGTAPHAVRIAVLHEAAGGAPGHPAESDRSLCRMSGCPARPFAEGPMRQSIILRVRLRRRGASGVTGARASGAQLTFDLNAHALDLVRIGVAVRRVRAAHAAVVAEECTPLVTAEAVIVVVEDARAVAQIV